MDPKEYERQAEWDRLNRSFSDWAVSNKHKILTSFPKSGRNYLGDMLRRASDKIIRNGIPTHENDYSDVFMFVLHRARWEIRSDNAKYILLIRDPRDAILSRSYTEANDRGAYPVSSLLDNEYWVRTNIQEWKNYFHTFLPYECHLVQYEELCMFPVETLTGIFEYLEIEPIADLLSVVKSVDCIKPDPVRETEFEKVDFESGFERYRRHCLKWQRDPYLSAAAISRAYLNLIWEEAGDTMEQYGYERYCHGDMIFTKGYSEEMLRHEYVPWG